MVIKSYNINILNSRLTTAMVGSIDTRRFLIALLLEMYVVFGQNYMTTFKKTAMNDLTCSGSDVLLIDLQPSMIQCAIVCEKEILCTAFTFRTSDGKCVRCKGNDGQLVSNDQGMGSFIRQGPWSTPCECDGENRQCYEGVCMCTIGYSLEATTLACVDGCETYGDTFQKYNNYRIAGGNYRKIELISVDACLQTCLDNPACASVDYYITPNNTTECHLQKITALYWPDNLIKTQGFEHYNRNC